MFDGSKLLGVLGGSSPLTGAAFMQRLVLLDVASPDRPRVPAALWSDTRTPDPAAAAMGRGPSPLPLLLTGLVTLERLGVDVIVVPCAAAHLWYRDLCAASRVPVLHIVECVAADLRRRGVQGGSVAVLADRTTLHAGLYQNRLLQLGYEPLPASDEDCLRLTPSIRSLMAGDVNEARRAVLDFARNAHAAGAACAVMGCTELAPLLHTTDGDYWPLPMIDPIASQARAAIEWFRGALDPWTMVVDIPEAESESVVPV